MSITTRHDIITLESILPFSAFLSKTRTEIKAPTAPPRMERIARTMSLFPSSFFDLTFEFIAPEAKPKTLITNKYISTFPIFIYHSILDDKEIDSIFKTSTLKEKIYESQVYKPIYKEEKQPLLPLNLGQLGLVLTSGCLDGIVDEGNGFAHIIKGRVEKRILQKKIDDNDTIKNVSTTINKEL